MEEEKRKQCKEYEEYETKHRATFSAPETGWAGTRWAGTGWTPSLC